MHYYEVYVADNHYRGDEALTYSSEAELKELVVVSVPLRNRLASGFIAKKVSQPKFSVKPIKSVLSETPLPAHCLELANWLRSYYACSLGEALRLFAPSLPSVRRQADLTSEGWQENLDLEAPLTQEQTEAIDAINKNESTTVLLHGETGSGKTRVYLELAEHILKTGRSVIILTPEIALTSQLKMMAAAKLASPIHVLHSELSSSTRKKVWFSILESKEPLVIIGPRSALFAPLAKVGLIIVDEAHEPAYKQEQSPRFHAVRVASVLGNLTESKVILGSATPTITDYYLASARQAVVSMKLQAKSNRAAQVVTELVDHRIKDNFSKNKYLSNNLIEEIKRNLQGGHQTLIYYNRRGSARLILCDNCGWQFMCPNCDIPVIYHADHNWVQCHICGFREQPPKVCPNCHNPDVIYTSIGTKALFDIVKKLFPAAHVQRFDSDSKQGERLNEAYDKVFRGEIDILVGTQLLAKGLDLPKLTLVGVISAETSLTLPDYTSEERTFQLLYQAMGRVGRHGPGKVIIQSHDPDSSIIKAAAARDYALFYKKALVERQNYRFPPFAYLLKFTCRRATLESAQKAAQDFREDLLSKNGLVEVIGPSASFYSRRGNNYYYQLIVKAKDRPILVELAKTAPSGWTIDLDPVDLI